MKKRILLNDHREEAQEFIKKIEKEGFRKMKHRHPILANIDEPGNDEITDSTREAIREAYKEYLHPDRVKLYNSFLKTRKALEDLLQVYAESGIREGLYNPRYLVSNLFDVKPDGAKHKVSILPFDFNAGLTRHKIQESEKLK